MRRISLPLPLREGEAYSFTGIGSQVQRPLALVVVGGILLAPVLILILLPVLIDVFSCRTAPAEAPAE